MPLNCTGAIFTLASRQHDLLVTFYEQLFQQKPLIYRPNVYAEFKLPDLRLGIFQPQKRQVMGSNSTFNDNSFDLAGENQKFPGIHPVSLCLEVQTLELAIEHLGSLGYPPPGEIRIASHGREIDAYDPEGNWLILYQSVSQE